MVLSKGLRHGGGEDTLRGTMGWGGDCSCCGIGRADLEVYLFATFFFPFSFCSVKVIVIVMGIWSSFFDLSHFLLVRVCVFIG
ncbi:hypothetical protein BO82DRAFT_198709 [Aspergillus uvarum CBS 121591]|uniref:Transmembrane protein n=1 Tax=Aspergillus uvarum CBS 121591 TaxID=1448315 RepID=A0A319E1U7_9EURO|nr:hypothetical protein BO82DRAFT_198709 [Aspergillus uvarum CBS 121591]PYH85062.1 hypothetical protein BO82DRAFT_198709 [Aspergillus uvarum CBS 121591]